MHVQTEDWKAWNLSISKSRKAFFSGAKAFRAGALVNPYQTGNFLHKEWERGFNEKYYERLDRTTQ